MSGFTVDAGLSLNMTPVDSYRTFLMPQSHLQEHDAGPDADCS